MEKLLYPLWKDSSLSGDAFREELLHQLAPELAAARSAHLCSRQCGGSGE